MTDSHQHGTRNEQTSGARHYAPSTNNPYAQGGVAPKQGASHKQRAVAMKPASSYSRSDAHYQHADKQPSKGRASKKPVVITLIVLLALAGAGAYLWFNPPFYNVTINGATETVDAGTTLQGVIDKGYASPKAGNLLAVDGSVAKEGGGQEFVATVNGDQTSDPATKLAKDADVTMENGGDVTETYTETTQAVPHTTSDASMDASSYYNGSIHIYSDGEDGEETVRTGDVSGKTVTTVTKQPVAAGYHTYTANVGNDKVIALTFDDGPWPTSTSEILQVLQDNGAKATFFEIGNQISNNADVVKALAAAGMQIGSHSWDHASGSGQGVNMTYMTADEQVTEVTKGFDAIDSTLGTKVSRVFRAPGGNYYGSLISTIHPYVTAEVGWDVDTKDWSRPGVSAVVSAIESVKPGQIVLMHDGGGDRSQSVEALKEALPVLKSQGYSFITIDELLKYGVPSTAK